MALILQNVIIFGIESGTGITFALRYIFDAKKSYGQNCLKCANGCGVILQYFKVTIMQAVNRSLWVTILIILIHFIALTMNASAAENRSEWDTVFQATFKDADPMLGITDGNDGGKLAWQAHYWIRAYVSMAQTYGDSFYVEKAVKLIDFIFDHTDPARIARGELNLSKQPYFSAPLYFLNHREQAAPGWRILAFGTEWRIQTLDDGQITNAIMRFVDLVFSDIRFSAYRVKAQQYLEKVENIVNTHNDLFAYDRFENMPGSYYYPNVNGTGLYSGAIPFNQSATMAVSLLLLDKVKGGSFEHRRKAAAILEYFKKHLRLKANNAYDWDYNPQRPTSGDTKTGDEDFNHAHIDVGFIVLAYQQGLDLDVEDMHRFANTLTKNVYRGDGELAWSIDGAEIGSGKNYWPVGFDWIDLSEFDPQVLDIAKEVYRKHYAKPTWARPFLGWAEILRWHSK